MSFADACRSTAETLRSSAARVGEHREWMLKTASTLDTMASEPSTRCQCPRCAARALVTVDSKFNEETT